jgi:hypothetical protein
MLVNRRTFISKPGRLDEAVALLQEARQVAQSVGFADTQIRIYATELGPFDTVILETEHEHFAAYERDWDAIFSNPTVADQLKEWFTRWSQVAAPGGSNEIWRVVE